MRRIATYLLKYGAIDAAGSFHSFLPFSRKDVVI